MTETIAINATPERVWKELTDLEGRVRWSDRLREMWTVDGEPVALGSRMRIRMDRNGFKVAVTKFDPPTHLVTGAKNPLDIITKELGKAHLPDGTPLPDHKIRQMACDTEMLPTIFRGASQPLDLGRARRIASPAQRVALIARDRECIGCGASAAWCQAHHIIPGSPEAQPTSKTSVSYAPAATTRYTTTAGEYARPPPDSTPSDHPAHETHTAAHNAQNKENDALRSSVPPGRRIQTTTYEAVVIIPEDPRSLGDWSWPQHRFVGRVVRPCRLRKRR